MKRSIFMIMIMALLVTVQGCYTTEPKEEKYEDPAAAAGSKKTDAPGIHTEERQEEPKDKTYLENMTLEEKIYQMFFVTPESITGVQTAVQAGQSTQTALLKHPVGGIIYFAKNIQTPEQTRKMIEHSQSYSKIPLFIGVDEEGGIVSRIGKNSAMGVTHFPNMKEIGDSGDTTKSYDAGKTIGSQIKALGFNMDFAPDADVLVNPNNTEIGPRSFGSDPALVADMVKMQIRGFHDAGMAAAAKHFPGHGSTDKDSHKGFSKSMRTEQQLRETEWVPFRAAIEENVDFILVSHMALTQIEPSGTPASLSEKIISGYLKEELGFSGIVITDSLSMGAVTENYGAGKAAVMAVQAGADMILMPPDVDAAFSGIYEAVQNGEIEREQIEASVKKILEAKRRNGIIAE